MSGLRKAKGRIQRAVLGTPGLRVLVLAVRNYILHQSANQAGSLAFSSVLAMFPLLILLSASAGYLGSPGDAAALVSGAVLLLVTLGGITANLPDRTGAFLIASVATVAAVGLLAWDFVYRRQHPTPPRRRLAPRAAPGLEATAARAQRVRRAPTARWPRPRRVGRW